MKDYKQMKIFCLFYIILSFLFLASLFAQSAKPLDNSMYPLDNRNIAQYGSHRTHSILYPFDHELKQLQGDSTGDITLQRILQQTKSFCESLMRVLEGEEYLILEPYISIDRRELLFWQLDFPLKETRPVGSLSCRVGRIESEIEQWHTRLRLIQESDHLFLSLSFTQENGNWMVSDVVGDLTFVPFTPLIFSPQDFR